MKSLFNNDLVTQKVVTLLQRLADQASVLELCGELGLQRKTLNEWLENIVSNDRGHTDPASSNETERYKTRNAELEKKLRDLEATCRALQSRLELLKDAEASVKRAEEASQNTERRYQRIFQSVPVSIWEEDYSGFTKALEELRDHGVTDIGAYLDEHPDFVQDAVRMIRVTDVNRETLDMFGAITKDELLGSPARILPEGSEDLFREELKAIAERKPSFEAETAIHTLNGVNKSVLVRIAIPTNPEHFGHMLLTLLDITERKQAEEALRRSEERFRAIFEAARDAIFIKDGVLRYTHVNPSLRMLLGVDGDHLIGSTDEELYGQEAGKHLREVDLRVLSGETLEEEHIRPILGAQRTFHDIRAPLRNSEGNVIGICGISRDITERKKFSQALRADSIEYPSAYMRATLEKARYGAATDCVILLLGESGSGKDHMARYIHAHSTRNKGPFFSINCAAISSELVESELFGHESGAFTGARSRKRGLLELAEGGTILLNEIGELPLSMQSKLLTFLDTKSFIRVGGEKSITVNARLIAATHRDLKSEVAVGRFSEALFYRLDVFSIKIPPLRERLDDIPALVEELSSKLIADMHLPCAPIADPEVMERFTNYHWPGNIRELRNVIERFLILPNDADQDITFSASPGGSYNWTYSTPFPPKSGLDVIRNEITRSLCEEALKRTKGNKKASAKLLGISRYSLYRHMKSFGLECDNVTDQDFECDNVTHA